MSEEILTPFSQNDYEVLKREVLYQGVYRLARYHLRHRQYAGDWSQPYTREIYERPGAAAILPYDPVLDQVVLIEQFRAGAIANPQSPWLLELVAGLYDANEIPTDAARREAKEEADCDILDIYPLYAYFVSPGGSNEFVNLYVGRVDASNIGGTHGLKDENEDIRAFTLSVEDAFIMLQEGKIKNSPAIIALNGYS